MVNGEIAIYITIVAVLITFFGILLSDKRTRQSLELRKKEMKIQLRPWLVLDRIEPYGVGLENGDLIGYEKFLNTNQNSKPKFVRMNMNVKNVGPVLARDIKSWQYNGEKEIKVADFIKTKEPLAKGSVIMPQDYLGYNFDILWQDWEDANNYKKNYFVSLTIDYQINELERSSIGGVWKITHGGAPTYDTLIRDSYKI